MADANELAMVLAEGPPDKLTYANPSWQDADGNLYAVSSFEAGPTFVGKALSMLARANWDKSQFINMAGARRAQARVVLAQEPQKARPDIILALPGVDGLAALEAMGLTLVPVKM
jgi:hypothetical protein